MDHVIQIALNGIPIADGTAAGGRCASLQINGQALVQEFTPIRAAAVAFADRFGKSHDLDLTVTTEHADVADALAFLAARRGAVPGVAALALTLTIGGKAVAISTTRAKWGGTDGTCEGRSSTVRYTIRTGLLTVAVTGGATSGPADFWIPTEPLALIAPLAIPAGRSAQIAAGQCCFAFAAEIDGTLEISASGALELVA